MEREVALARFCLWWSSLDRYLIFISTRHSVRPFPWREPIWHVTISRCEQRLINKFWCSFLSFMITRRVCLRSGYQFYLIHIHVFYIWYISARVKAFVGRVFSANWKVCKTRLPRPCESPKNTPLVMCVERAFRAHTVMPSAASAMTSTESPRMFSHVTSKPKIIRTVVL